MICFDREIPETGRCLRAMGAQLVACPLACDTEPLDRHLDYAHNEMVTRCRAAENEVFIAVVNHSGRFNGGSFVVGPGGETVVQLGTEPEVRTVDLPVTGVSDVIHANAFGWMGWGYRKQEVYDRHRTTEST
jgi:predicted amidohydrolase